MTVLLQGEGLENTLLEMQAFKKHDDFPWESYSVGVEHFWGFALVIPIFFHLELTLHKFKIKVIHEPP